MSDSDMELDFDSEEEMNDLRKMREILKLDQSSSSSSSRSASLERSSPSQASGLKEAATKTALHYVDVSTLLNGHLDEKCQHFDKLIDRTMSECLSRLKKISGINDSDENREESFRYINCGRPYFKDKESFPAPDNADAIFMAENDMFDFSTITSVPGWTMRDKSQLWTKLEKMSRKLKKKEIQSKIAELKREIKTKTHSEQKCIEKQINKLQKELNKVNKLKLEDIALPIDEEYDWEEVTHSLDRRHSPSEYKSLWKLYLHPSINKSNWSKSEHQLLQKIASEHGLRNWIKIAEKMGNNRTGYQCFVYFRTNMNNSTSGKKWSEEEVDYLLRLIDYYQENNYIPWVKVAALMENRTKIQIYNKYTRLFEERKGRFLPEEDSVILTCDDNFGPDYKRMTQFLPGRSATQIRVRHQALTKRRVSIVWTVEEDRLLLQLLSHQDNEANYASIAKFFPGKDRIHIRARYVTLVKWMRRNPNDDIVNAPRRGSRRLGHGKASENLNVAIESLKTRIQTEAIKKKSSRINADSSEDAMEDAIIAALTNEIKWRHTFQGKTGRAHELLTLENDDENVYDEVNGGCVNKILFTLKAKLNADVFGKYYINPNKSKVTSNDHTCVVKVRSYSKRNEIESIVLTSLQDVWERQTFKTREYVLPPHYATIVGLQKLMKFIATKGKVDTRDMLNFPLLKRRNVLLREHIKLLVERCNTLFTWPMIISSECPNLQITIDSEPGASMNKEGGPSGVRHRNISKPVYETVGAYVTIDSASEPEDDDEEN